MRWLFGSGVALLIASMVIGPIVTWVGAPLNYTLWAVPVFNTLGLFCFIGALSQFGKRHQSELEDIDRSHRIFLIGLLMNALGQRQLKDHMSTPTLQEQIIAQVEELKKMEPLCRAAQRHLRLLTDICVFLRFSNELTSDEAKQLRRMLACLITELADADKRAKDELNLGLDLDSQHDSILQLEAQKAALLDVYARLSLGKHLRDDRPTRQWEQTLNLAIARYLSGWRPPKGEDAKRIATVRWERLMRDEFVKIGMQDSVVMPEEAANPTEPMTTDAR